MASILVETGLPAKRLELEITESVLLHHSEKNIAALHELRALGVSIALDDFGTGYSSLSYLRTFPFDKIKIDRTFVSAVDENGQSAAIVRAVIGLGRALDIAVIAEGVETEGERVFLLNEGCAEMQGYFVGRPRHIEEYGDLIGARVATARAAGLGF